jgi:alkylation response protein AidB-like acyl-CoA dehydrogenase
VYLALTDEQQFLCEAAAGALGRIKTLESARAALDGGGCPDLWPVAVQAGWSGLLVGADADGAELGAYEALLVLDGCGSRLADAGLLGHLPATALLELAGADRELRSELASGDKRAAFVDSPALVAESDGDTVVLTGGAHAVLDASDADVLVIATDSTAAVIDAAEVEIEPQPAYDGTRSLATVTFAAVGARRLPVPAERVRDGRDLQRAMLAAESVGAADACLQMAREYAIDRHAFGRAIGSYQAIKHKLVEMMRRVEGARSLLVGAGRAWAEDRDGFALAANAARVLAAGALDYAAPENIFIHGGVGATWEHDAQLYYRRAELSRRLAGGVEAAADDVAEELFARMPA